MPVLQGSTSGSIIGVPYNISSTIKSFVITNTTGGAATVGVYIIEYGTNNKVYIAPLTIAANDAYKSDINITVLAGYTIYITTNVAIDYYFSISG